MQKWYFLKNKQLLAKLNKSLIFYLGKAGGNILFAPDNPDESSPINPIHDIGKNPLSVGLFFPHTISLPPSSHNIFYFQLVSHINPLENRFFLPNHVQQKKNSKGNSQMHSSSLLLSLTPRQKPLSPSMLVQSLRRTLSCCSPARPSTTPRLGIVQC